MAEAQQFPYVTSRNARGDLFARPILSLTLANHNRSVEVAGLLDTGADVNVLPYPIGIDLGAVWDEQRPIPGLSGNLANYEARGIVLTAAVGRFEPVRLVFAWTRAESVPLMLGQMNFFAEFDVCFFRSKSVFEIHPISDN